MFAVLRSLASRVASSACTSVRSAGTCLAGLRSSAAAQDALVAVFDHDARPRDQWGRTVAFSVDRPRGAWIPRFNLIADVSDAVGPEWIPAYPLQGSGTRNPFEAALLVVAAPFRRRRQVVGG